jgi:hypothetical protein
MLRMHCFLPVVPQVSYRHPGKLPCIGPSEKLGLVRIGHGFAA